MKNSADQTLSLIERGRGGREVKFTDPSAAWQREKSVMLKSLPSKSHTDQTEDGRPISLYSHVHTALPNYYP